MIVRRLAALAIAAVIACKGDSKPPPAKDPGAPATTRAAKPDLARKPAAAPELTHTAVEARATAFLAHWVTVQNGGDVAGYRALYDKKHFDGIKRTTKGKVVRFDNAGWLADREKMFKNKPQVAAQEASVTSWLEPGSRLKPGVIVVRFVQRWKTERYADHGIKVLHLWRSPAGELTIIYEDLVNAEPGWGTPAAGATALALPVAGSTDEAMALWGKLGITGAKVDAVADTLPTDPEVARPLALALIERSDFACTKVIEYSECGTEYSEAAPVDPAAPFDDPCVRRRLLDWALGQLTPPDLDAQVARLETIIGQKYPDDATKDILGASVDAAEDTRIRLLKAAVAADAEDDAAAALDGLSPGGLERAFTEAEVIAAVGELVKGGERHLAVLTEAAVDARVPVETRLGVVSLLAGSAKPETRAALAKVADSDSCQVAMAAAEALAAAGDRSHIPARPTTSREPLVHARVLCMLLHASDTAYASSVVEQYVDPRHPVDTLDRHESDWEPPTEDTDKLTREEAGITSIPAELGDQPTLDTTSASARRVEIELVDAPDGGMYLRSITTVQWSGCGC